MVRLGGDVGDDKVDSMGETIRQLSKSLFWGDMIVAIILITHGDCPCLLAAPH
jgi:hypothetical protein